MWYTSPAQRTSHQRGVGMNILKLKLNILNDRVIEKKKWIVLGESLCTISHYTYFVQSNSSTA